MRASWPHTVGLLSCMQLGVARSTLAIRIALRNMCAQSLDQGEAAQAMRDTGSLQSLTATARVPVCKTQVKKLLDPDRK